MEAAYVLELIEARKGEIQSLLSVQGRINMVIDIIQSAPIPEGTPVGFAFMETMNVESDFLLQALRMYEKAGRCLLVPNDFSKVEAKNATAALNKIYDICESGI